ncbi:MAG: hypothetical protein R3C49_03120 [Planctomycetaceae bacterium]
MSLSSLQQTPADVDILSSTSPAGNQTAGDVLSWRQWLLMMAMLLPWLSIVTAHYLGNGSQATGFFQYDQPYYVANGRAAFERGNGVLYPNPSDADPDSPIIYFHWLPWIMGCCVSVLHCEPGLVNAALTAALLPLFGWLTWKLICRRTQQRRMSMLFLALWGGGVLSLLGILKSFATGTSLIEAVFEFDPTNGLWFLNWGRNTVYSVEITYHCLVAAAWLCVLTGRNRLALLPAGLLAATHPWSGIELLLVLNAWFLMEAVRHRRGEFFVNLGIAVLLLTLLLGYYKVWLPRFPTHAALQDTWSLNWRMEWSTVLYAYTPVATLAFLALWKKRFLAGRQEQFLLLAAAVAFGLTIHDRILPRPVQPLHFSRGYIWTPLFLIGIPQVVHLISRLQRIPTQWRRPLIAACLCLAVFDNVAFSLTHCYWQYTATGEEGFLLTTDDRAVLDVLQTAESPVIFCEDLDFSYLLPTYVPSRPWLCHKFNTPDYVKRQLQLRPALADNGFQPELLPPAIDIVILKAARNSSALQSSPNWQPLLSPNRTWQLWKRTSERTAEIPGPPTTEVR